MFIIIITRAPDARPVLTRRFLPVTKESAGTPVRWEFNTCHYPVATGGIREDPVMPSGASHAQSRPVTSSGASHVQWQQVATGVSWWQCDRISVCA
jgi:hypothetical protein